MRKKEFYIFLLIIIVLFGSYSCSIKKRLYQPGYHVEWNKNNQETKPLFGNNANPKNKEEINPKNQSKIVEESISASSTKVIAQTEVIQKFEPIYTSNNERINKYEIVNSARQKPTFPTAPELVSDKDFSSVEKNNPIKSGDIENGTKKIHWLAIAGIAFSILAWPLFGIGALNASLFFCAAGIVLCIIALDVILENPESYRGKLLAIFGIALNPIVLGILWITLSVIISMYI